MAKGAGAGGVGMRGILIPSWVRQGEGSKLVVRGGGRLVGSRVGAGVQG